MVNTLAKKLAMGIKKVVPESPQSVEVLKYSISYILNAFFIIGSSLLISLFTGKVIEVIIILIGYALLRQVSGGVHLKSGTLCIVVSTAGATALSFVSFDSNILILFTAISMLLALVFAPSRIEKQTRIPSKYYPLLKLLSLIIISSNLVIHSAVLASAFLLQALTLVGRRGVKNG
ncbi:accessory regulator AgrB [Cohnella endophytica]|uniref:Accessory regulator AgrB n=1 Tax=Cohnella endophytica TaxID=2419778 RepID=A0A494XNZ4_9BACL|nr:accessory gene regulator B family protein [Cohnella endophytica]RKP49839.1 accessory regulator AgrB [Cohnella endophytica]